MIFILIFKYSYKRIDMIQPNTITKPSKTSTEMINLPGVSKSICYVYIAH